MSLKEAYGGIVLRDPRELEGDRGIVLGIFEKYRDEIPSDVFDKSYGIVERAFKKFRSSPEELMGTATSVFLVHTRRNRMKGEDVEGNESEQLDDTTRCIPMLNPKYGIKEEDVEVLWNSLPPFKVGEVSGTLNGKEIKCSIISVPITPKALEDCDSPSKRSNYARPRIEEAAELANRMGAKIIGLGETLAALTRHGKSLQDKFPEMKITTGHAFTTYFMNEWVKFVAEKGKIDIEESQVTIIGANGSIGSAMTEMLLLDGVKRLRLHDKSNMTTTLEKKKAEILHRYPDMEISITGGDDNLKEACKGSRIVLVVASTSKPFINAEHLDKGTFVINDSQPPGITFKAAQEAESTTIWVVGKLPSELTNTFSSGLLGSAEWTCLLEVLSLGVLGPDVLDTVGPVTRERVGKVDEIVNTLGIELPEPQAWGVPSNLQ